MTLEAERATGGGRLSQTPATELLSAWARRGHANQGESGPPAASGLIEFGGGIPDPETLPKDALLAAAARVLAQDAPGALRYGGAQGEELMRRWLAARLNTQEDAGAGPENFFLTSGSGQAIQMVIAAFSDPGDVALVERPSYPGSLRTFRAYGVELAGVDMDEEGVVIDALERTLTTLAAAGRTPRLFYTMPTLHNPTGITTTIPRREAVVELCDRFGVLIMEDDAYGEIRCEGRRPPSYYRLSGGQGALRISTVSKMLATGLRVGWVTGRKDLVDSLTRLRFDGGLSPFLIRTVAEFCSSGDQDAHLEHMIPLYREKRDRTLAALAERCAGQATWTHPEGGFFLWMTLDPAINPAKLRESMQSENVFARTGMQFFPDGGGEHNLRLCFSTLSVADIEEGVRRLGRALDQARF